tara:strand:+ start:241 stop:378 length:138 start_codon:yes stop_codon:yes gene_type:complete
MKLVGSYFIDSPEVLEGLETSLNSNLLLMGIKNNKALVEIKTIQE